MIALKALPRHSLNFSDILKPILPQFLLLPQMCVGSTFLLFFFSKYSCVYILCLWACPNLYAFYTSDFFAFPPAHPVTPVTPTSKIQAYQRRPRCMSYSSLSRQFQWQPSIFKNSIELDQCLWKLFTINIDEKPINNNQKTRNCCQKYYTRTVSYIELPLILYLTRQDYTAVCCAPSACLPAL